MSYDSTVTRQVHRKSVGHTLTNNCLAGRAVVDSDSGQACSRLHQSPPGLIATGTRRLVQLTVSLKAQAPSVHIDVVYYSCYHDKFQSGEGNPSPRPVAPRPLGWMACNLH